MVNESLHLQNYALGFPKAIGNGTMCEQWHDLNRNDLRYRLSRETPKVHKALYSLFRFLYLIAEMGVRVVVVEEDTQELASRLRLDGGTAELDLRPCEGVTVRDLVSPCGAIRSLVPHHPT